MMLHKRNKIGKTYVTPGKSVAFSSPGRVKKYFGKKYKLTDIKRILSSIEAYSVNKQFKRPRIRNPYFVFKKREQMQFDLIDVRELVNENNGVKFLLCGIDIFTRVARVVPLNDKSADSVLLAMKRIIEELGKPEIIGVDRGKEFENVKFLSWAKQNDITVYFPSSEHKASFAERFNRTIQDLIYRILTLRGNNKYVDLLPDIQKTYNNRIHRSLHFMTPNQADEDKNQYLVRQVNSMNHDKAISKQKRPSLKEGDTVRILRQGDKFRRGYHESFSRELFKIVEVYDRFPIPMYTVTSIDKGDTIQGRFYENELQKIYLEDI